MKHLLFLLIAAGTLHISAFSQSDRYMGAMAGTLHEFAAASDGASMAAVAAKFERIGDAEKTQWLPYYYAALTKARMSMQGMGGDKDAMANEAETLINKAQAIQKNSENYCVVYMIASARMLVDPQSRYMTYMAPMTEALDQAKKLDPSNPRPYALLAIAFRNTPEQFGGGCKAAKPDADKALSLYASFQPASPISPNWGKDIVDGVVNGCKL